MAYDADYGTCQYCGAKKVLNPKTQKVFCADKCWLKKTPPAPQNTPVATQTPNPPINGSQRIVELLESIDAHLEKLEYNSLKSDSGETIPF
jgi:hypothetical protein